MGSYGQDGKSGIASLTSPADFVNENPLLHPRVQKPDTAMVPAVNPLMGRALPVQLTTYMDT